MSTESFEHFKSNPKKDSVFQFYDKTFSPCVDSNKALNENLETEYQMTFRCDESKTFNPKWTPEHIDWDSEEFFVLAKSGKILYFSNSEWAGFQVQK